MQGILRAMGDPKRLERDDWEAIVHAPFHVYSAVASIDGTPLEAQFRRLGEELEVGRGTFAESTIGRTMVETLTENLDALWAGYHALGRSSEDGLNRAMKALGKAPDGEALAIRDWLLVLAKRIAEARRTVGAEAISLDEASTIRDIAAWLDRPAPESDLT